MKLPSSFFITYWLAYLHIAQETDIITMYVWH